MEISRDTLKLLLDEILASKKEIDRLNLEIFEITETAVEYSRRGIKIHSEKR
jgi:hypothetical protein